MLKSNKQVIICQSQNRNSMKKQNRNAFAYIRQPNVQQSEDPFSGAKAGNQSPNHSMFNEIVGHMDGHLTTYLSKLVSKNQKQQQKKRKTLQKSLNHERTKSYADIQVQTPTNSKNPLEKGHSHRGSHPSTQINNIFFSVSNSPTNQKPLQIKKQKKITQKNTRSSSFIQNLDGYITDLTLNKSFASKKYESSTEENTLERKSIQKTRQNSAHNLKIIEKLESCLKRQKQLKIANQILASENEKIKNKFRKNKIDMKRMLQELYQYAQETSMKLKQEKRQKKRLQQFINQFQSKFIKLRPERKTSQVTNIFRGARPRIQDYLLSETTEQDEQESAHVFPSEPSKSINRRTALPRSTAKNSRISGFNIEQLSAMLASKNFDYDDQSQNQEV